MREAPKQRGEKPKTTGLSKNEQKELDGILDRIDEAERTAAAIEAELGDPTLYAGGKEDGRSAAIQTRLTDARAAVSKLTARWEQLEEKRGGT